MIIVNWERCEQIIAGVVNNKIKQIMQELIDSLQYRIQRFNQNLRDDVFSDTDKNEAIRALESRILNDCCMMIDFSPAN